MIYLKQLFISEQIKLHKVNLLFAALLPIFVAHIIVLFNAGMMDLPLNSEFSNGYREGVLSNWYLFLSVFALFHLTYKFWLVEIQNGCWQRLMYSPVPLWQVLFVKFTILMLLISLQSIVLILSADMLSYGHSTTLFLDTDKMFMVVGKIALSVLSIVPAMVLTSLFILWSQRAAKIASVAILLTVIHVFIRDHELAFINLWSWPYLAHRGMLSFSKVVFMLFISGLALWLTSQIRSRA